MLQKGFLRPPKKEETARAIKKSRVFFFAGVLTMLMGFIILMVRMQQEGGQISMAWLILVIAGFLLISVSLWINFFAQNKHRRR